MVINDDNFGWAFNEVMSYESSEKIYANSTQYLDLMMSFIRYYRKRLDKDVLVMDLVRRLVYGVMTIYLNSQIDGSNGCEGMLGDVQRFLANYKDSIPTKEECDQFNKENGIGSELDYYETKEVMCVCLGRLYKEAGYNFDKNESWELCIYFYDIAIDIHKKGLINLSHMLDKDYSDYEEVKNNIHFVNMFTHEETNTLSDNNEEKESTKYDFGIPYEKPSFHSEYRNGKYIVVNDNEPSSSSKLKPILIGVAVFAIVIFLFSLLGKSENENRNKLLDSYWLEDSSSDLWYFANNQLYGTSGTYNFEIDGENLSFKLLPSDEWDFFSDSKKAIDGNWNFALEEKNLKLNETGGKGRTLRFTKLTETDLDRLGDNFSQIWQNNILGDMNFATITGNTKKNQMKIPSRSFNQISSGSGYKTYSVKGNVTDFGNKCLFDYEFYKINNKTQSVEVMGITFNCPSGQYSRVISNNLRNKLEEILSCKMINNKMHLDIGSEGFSSNGHVSLGGSKRCSYAIAYNESWIAIVVGFNEKSFKNFIGIE